MKSRFAFLCILVLACVHPLAAAPRPKEAHGPVPVVEPVPDAPFLHAGPLVGHVTDTTARLWAKASNKATLGFKIGKLADLSDGRVIKGPSLASESSFTGHVEVPQLQPATRYYYVPLLNGEAAMKRPYPSFITAPVLGSPGRLRVAFGSCVGPRGYTAAATFARFSSFFPADVASTWERSSRLRALSAAGPRVTDPPSWCPSTILHSTICGRCPCSLG